MPQRTVFNVTLAAVAANNIAASQTPSGAGTLTLNGSLTSGGTYTAADAAHIIGIHSGSTETATFIVTGTNNDGVSTSETVAAPNNSTVNTVNFYKTVTSISISGAAVGAITVGTINSVQSPTIEINSRTSSMQVSNAVIVSGTISYTLAHTWDNIMHTDANSVGHAANKPEVGVTYINDATLAAKTDNEAALLALPVEASHLTVNSYSTGATLRWNLVEAYAKGG